MTDTSYNVQCIVQSTGNESNKQEYSTQKTIYVFKPEIVFQDSIMNLGDTANYEGTDPANKVTKNLVSIEWKHDGPIENGADANLGPAPKLVYDYDKPAAQFTSDTPVKIESITAVAPDEGTMTHKLANNFDYLVKAPNGIKIYRDTCGFANCTHKAKQPVDMSEGDRVNFIVHLNTFDLIINKTGTQQIDHDGDEAQTYLFRVTREDGFSLDVTVVGDGSTTVKGLLRGEYDVTELSDWSWRYETVDSEGNIVSNVVTFDSSAENVVSNDGTYTASFTNGRKMPYWLSGDSYCRNWWSSTGIQQTFNPGASN